MSYFLSCTVRANVPRTRYVCNNMLFLYFSSYPDQRVKKDPDDLEMGVIGSVSLLQNANLSTQPITSFDWSPDKVSRADPENSERGAGTLATL